MDDLTKSEKMFIATAIKIAHDMFPREFEYKIHMAINELYASVIDKLELSEEIQKVDREMRR